MMSTPKMTQRQGARHRQIPERVHNAIAAQQKASEKLVGWVQLSVVLFFGLLYGVSPKTFSRDYVAYLTANRILIGAELEKVVIILAVTAILAVAINRAHRILIRTVAERTAAHDLARFFSPEIASRIEGVAQSIDIVILAP